MLRIFQRKILPSRKSRYASVDQDMFNRSREVERLSQLLMSSPMLSIITGPVNSGKSKLLDHVLTRLSEKATRGIPVYSINLRQGTYNSVQSLVDSLSADMKTWWTQSENV